ncbi:MAG: OsmC family protein [candidate division NC10 bacterium]|nr:OsmC family protein [candidate division NC10 bacterium]
MAEAKVRWITGHQFIGIDSTQHSVVLSSPEEGIGMKPSDLLLVSLAACSAYDVVEILQKKRLHLIGLEVQVQAEQDPEPPWAFRRIQLEYRVRGRDIPEGAVAQAIELSEKKYCSVLATISGVAEVKSRFQIETGEAGR